MATPYRDLFAAPGTTGLALAGLLARLPLPMTGIGLITLLSQLRGSYALAGAVSATFVLTYALLSPQVSRWVDRHGQGRVLPWATAASATGLLLLLACTVLRAPDWTLFAAAMLAGCMPSVSAMVRARWTAIHRGRPQLQTAYSLETVFDEVTFIAGPPLSVGLSVAVWPQAGVLAAALLLSPLSASAAQSICVTSASGRHSFSNGGSTGASIPCSAMFSANPCSKWPTSCNSAATISSLLAPFFSAR